MLGIVLNIPKNTISLNLVAPVEPENVFFIIFELGSTSSFIESIEMAFYVLWKQQLTSQWCITRGIWMTKLVILYVERIHRVQMFSKDRDQQKLLVAVLNEE